MPCPCGKTTRERLYCHRPDCGTLAMPSPDLPRPDVTVTEHHTGDSYSLDVVISRDGKAQSYTGTGSSSREAIKDTFVKVLNDPRIAESLPRG